MDTIVTPPPPPPPSSPLPTKEKEKTLKKRKKCLEKKQRLYEIETPFANKYDEHRRKKAIIGRIYRIKQKEQRQKIIQERDLLIEDNKLLKITIFNLLSFIIENNNNNNNNNNNLLNDENKTT